MRKLFRSGISIFLAACMACMPVGIDVPLYPADYAEAAVTNEFEGFTYSLTGFNAIITGYTGDAKELVIPQKFENKYKVVKINKEVFKENSNITSVDIPEGVTAIGVRAFYGCENLREVHLPSSITTWDEQDYNSSAFENCTKLEVLTMADGLSTLGQRAFAGCTSLKSVRVPSGITFFGNRVFMGCTGLTDLTLAEGMKYMGYRAFEGCTALKEVTIPSTIKSWGLIRSSGVMATTHENEAFRDCTSLEKVTFTEGLTTLENFQGTTGCPLVKELEVPSSVTNITYAFRNATGLEKIVIHEGLEEIGENAFCDCASLKEVRLPSTLTQIKYSAFDRCSSVESYYLFCGDLEGYKNLSFSDNTKIYCLPGTEIHRIMESSRPERLNEFPSLEDMQAKGYSAPYDGEEHDAVILEGFQEGDEVFYQLGDEQWHAGLPQIQMPGTCQMNIRVIRTNEGDSPLSLFQQSDITATVTKIMPAIQLNDVTAKETDTYDIVAENYDGDGDITYNYYDDDALTIPHEGKPTAPGTYYVQAVSSETELYAAAKSNAAKIVILEQAPENTPGGTPSAEPTKDPSTEQPASSPSAQPNSPTNPVVQPSPVPGTAATPAPNDDGQNNTVGKVALNKVKSTGKKTMEIQWKKSNEASGYNIWIGQNKKFTKGKKSYLIKSNKTVKKKIKNLKSKTTYYVKIRAYRTVNGKKQYGTFSSVKSVRIK